MAKKKQLLQAIIQHEQFIARAERMLEAERRGAAWPDEALFLPNELKGTEAVWKKLIADTTGRTVPECDWVSPLLVATMNHRLSGAEPMGWLTTFRDELRVSKAYLESLSGSHFPERKSTVHPVTTININGGKFYGSQIGTQNSSVEFYVGQLKINDTDTDAERELKELFAELRRAIEEAPELTRAKRGAAVSDLEGMTAELNKPAKDREEGTVELYLGRLKSIAGKSASILASLAKIGAFFGLG